MANNKLAKILIMIIIAAALLIIFVFWIQSQRVEDADSISAHYSTSKNKLAQYIFDSSQQPPATVYALEHIYYACDQLENLYLNEYNCCSWWSKNSNCSGVIASYYAIGCETPEKLCNQ